jgi:hypothetical protein
VKDKKILVISPEKWGNNFVSKHHYANYLSKQNEVYFLNPPNAFSKKNLGQVKCKTNSINSNLIIVDYVNLLPKLHQLPKTLQNTTYKKQAKQIQKYLNIEEFDIVWSFDPYRFWNLKNFSSLKYIYHCVDVHHAKYENACAKSADLIVLVSYFFLEKFVEFKHKLVTGHGAHVISKPIEPLVLPGDNKYKIGLIGNFFSTNLDYDQLLRIAEATTNKADLVLIGPIENNNLGGSSSAEVESKISALKKMNHVHFLGALHPDELNQYLVKMDIHLILYKDFKRNINPHKLIQYLATGNTVMSSHIFDHEIYPDNSIYQIENRDAGIEVNKLIYKLTFWNSDKLKNVRMDYAKNNDYDSKIKEIINSIDDKKNIQ